MQIFWADTKDTDENYLARCRARHTARTDSPWVGAGNFISVTVLTSQYMDFFCSPLDQLVHRKHPESDPNPKPRVAVYVYAWMQDFPSLAGADDDFRPGRMGSVVVVDAGSRALGLTRMEGRVEVFRSQGMGTHRIAAAAGRKGSTISTRREAHVRQARALAAGGSGAAGAVGGRCRGGAGGRRDGRSRILPKRERGACRLPGAERRTDVRGWSVAPRREARRRSEARRVRADACRRSSRGLPARPGVGLAGARASARRAEATGLLLACLDAFARGALTPRRPRRRPR